MVYYSSFRVGGIAPVLDPARKWYQKGAKEAATMLRVTRQQRREDDLQGSSAEDKPVRKSA